MTTCTRLARPGRLVLRHRFLRHRFLQHRGGVAAIEFAIVAPFLLALMFGILGYGMYFGAVHGVQQLAAEAARAAIAGLSNAERKALAEAAVMRSAASYPFLSHEGLVVASIDTDPATGTFTISLTYDASALPIFTLPHAILPPPTIARSASIQRGGF